MTHLHASPPLSGAIPRRGLVAADTFIKTFFGRWGSLQCNHSGGFPGGPVTKTPCFQCMGPGIRSLVRELDPTCCNQEFTLLQLKKKKKRILHMATKIEDSLCGS